MFAFAFKPSDPFGGVSAGWTTATLAGILDPQYAAIVWRTVWLSLLTTALCLLLATPAGYAIARAEPSARDRLMLLVIVPFWTSFLIRIFAWKVLLHPEGALKGALVGLGLVSEQAPLLYTPGAVLLVMVYTFLPFAILPIYAAAEKFDFRLLEAARDLGASPLRAFVLVFLPGIRSGLLTAVPGRLHPGARVVRDPRPGRRPQRRDARQQDRPAGVRRPQPAPGERPLRPPHPGRPAADGRGSGAAGAEAPRGSHHRGGRVRRSRFPLAVTWLLLAFFYLPIAVVVVSSFNGARFGGGFEGPTLDWYRRLFEHREIWPAVLNSLVIAVGATAVSVVLGTSAAIALHRYRGRLQRAHYALVYTPLVVPEILMGISLLLFFAAIGLELGLFSIFLAHVTFCLSYVAMVVLGRLQDFDDSVVEAALDLGAAWWTITWRILLPLLAPGILAGGAPRLHPLDRRLRDLVLRRRPRQHHAADPHLQHDQARGAAAHQRPLHAAAGGDLRRGLAQPAPHHPPEKP